MSTFKSYAIAMAISVSLLGMTAHASKEDQCDINEFNEEQWSLSNSDILATGVVGVLALRNVGEIGSHLYELCSKGPGSLWSPDITTVYHGVEVTGHIGNFANYVQVPSAWYGHLAIAAFNGYAAFAQYKTLARHWNAEAISTTAKVLMLFSSLDFVGHVIDGAYSVRSIWSDSN